jgi:hypothetical protein
MQALARVVSVPPGAVPPPQDVLRLMVLVPLLASPWLSLQLEWPANDELAVPVGGKVMRGLRMGNEIRKLLKRLWKCF